MTLHWKLLAVSASGAAIALLLALRLLVPSGGDPTVFLALGEDTTAISDHARQLLGDVTLREQKGHDGRFFFLQALDPFYLEPTEHAVLLDRPVYRAQRMLYPMLAGGGGLLPAEAVPWAMVAVNLSGLVAGTWFTSRLALSMGGSPWLGLAFPLNLGLISELYISGAGIVALLGVVAAALSLHNGRLVSAVIWLTVAVLAREVMLLAVLPAAVWCWRRRRAWQPIVVVPTAAVLAWGGYVRARLGAGLDNADVQEFVWVPFKGFIASMSRWSDRPESIVVALVLILLCVRLIIRWRTTGGALTWMAAPFALLPIVLSSHVWTEYYDITRAVSPVLTAYPFEVLLRRPREFVQDGKLNPSST